MEDIPDFCGMQVRDSRLNTWRIMEKSRLCPYSRVLYHNCISYNHEMKKTIKLESMSSPWLRVWKEAIFFRNCCQLKQSK